MTRILGLIAAAALVLGPNLATTSALGSTQRVAAQTDSTQARKAPTRDEWLHDVSRAMRGSGAYLRQRTASGDAGLAVNLDIDNTSVASYYDGTAAGAIPRILKFAQVAQKRGVVLLFNTGRSTDQRART